MTISIKSSSTITATNPYVISTNITDAITPWMSYSVLTVHETYIIFPSYLANKLLSSRKLPLFNDGLDSSRPRKANFYLLRNQTIAVKPLKMFPFLSTFALCLSMSNWNCLLKLNYLSQKFRTSIKNLHKRFSLSSWFAEAL